MSTPHPPFRFGVQVERHLRPSPSGPSSPGGSKSLGYSTMTMPDHFGDQLAPVPALQCAADATSTLRLGALVYDNDYKHPVVLAKELATMDVLSDGRVEVGLGAGWMVSDYEQSGIPYDSPGRPRQPLHRGARASSRAAFGAGPFSFDGEHYTITDYDGLAEAGADAATRS